MDDMYMEQERLQQEKEIELLVASGQDLPSVARVYFSQAYKDIVQKVRDYVEPSTDEPPATKPHALQTGSVARTTTEEEEYQTILEANNIVPDIDNDICILHKLIVDLWGPRLPELYSLIRNPMDYIRIVTLLGNTLTPSQPLRAFLPASVEMVVAVTLATASGRAVPAASLARALAACEVALALDTARTDLLHFIESRMTRLSPNVSALVGTGVAAKLMGMAGGVAPLCHIPACNLLVLGQSKKVTSTGLSNLGLTRHRGFLWDADFVKRTHGEFRRKAARLISAKVCLCARLDLNGYHKDGSYGRSMKDAITKQLEKAMAPPPAKTIKALPIPDEVPKKRRGGRRARKLKQMYSTSHARTGDDEAGVAAAGGGGATGTAKLRVMDAKTKAKTTDKLKQKLKAIGGMSSTVHGGATSITFTPVQGLEFMNPQREEDEEKVRVANERWFGKFVIDPARKVNQGSGKGGE